MNSLNKTRDKLNRVSKSFCAAKWMQVTIHLQLGQTHSCHHPSTHKIPLEEIAKDPSALHNTKYKKELRKEMLEGKRPKECGYCWNIEDSDPDNYSDRHYKSNDTWANPHIEQISKDPWDKNVNPTYLEVSFSNVCNFKCSYCSPKFSSKWVEELEQHGTYPTSTGFNDINWLRETGQMPIPHREENPYVEAFWKWWPDLYKDLEHFRITGGEPLLSKDTFKAIDWFIDHPSNLHNLSINSNLGVPDILITKYIEKMNRLFDKKHVKEVYLFTSVDGWGERAAYGRYGMEWNKYWDNVNRVLTECPQLNLCFMSTYNILSVTSFSEFLKNVHKLKVDYTNEYRKAGPILDIPYLRYPEHQKFTILTDDYKTFMEDGITIMKERLYDYTNPLMQGFHNFELNRFERLLSYWNSNPDSNNINRIRSDFYLFVNEHDRRRGTDFIKTFPEMEDFYQLCKNT